MGLPGCNTNTVCFVNHNVKVRGQTVFLGMVNEQIPNNFLMTDHFLYNVCIPDIPWFLLFALSHLHCFSVVYKSCLTRPSTA